MNHMIILFFLFFNLHSAQYTHVLSQFVIINKTEKKLVINNYYGTCQNIIGDNDYPFFSSFKLNAQQNYYHSTIVIKIGNGNFAKKISAEIRIPIAVLDDKVQKAIHSCNYVQISMELKHKSLCTFLPSWYTLISKEPGLYIRLV